MNNVQLSSIFTTFIREIYLRNDLSFILTSVFLKFSKILPPPRSKGFKPLSVLKIYLDTGVLNLKP
jgi:hypothetical protein